jgi:hypothetical protein
MSNVRLITMKKRNPNRDCCPSRVNGSCQKMKPSNKAKNTACPNVAISTGTSLPKSSKLRFHKIVNSVHHGFAQMCAGWEVRDCAGSDKRRGVVRAVEEVLFSRFVHAFERISIRDMDCSRSSGVRWSNVMISKKSFT